MKYAKNEIVQPPLTSKYLYLRYRKKLVNTAYSIFMWENLPDGVDERFLTGELIESGVCAIINTPNGFRAVRGNVGGEVNEYYMPTRFIYANPVLGSGEPLIGKECAVIWLTSEDKCPFSPSGGLSQLIDTTASLLADGMVSINVAQKNSRILLLASADNEATANSAELTIKDMYNGKPYKVVSKKLSDSFDVNPLANLKTAENLRQLIETHQYILANFFMELGINANYNLKRERLLQSEVELNMDSLDPLIDDLERTVNGGIDICNALYGTNIKFKVRRYGEEARDMAEQNEGEQQKESFVTSQTDDEDKSVVTSQTEEGDSNANADDK